MKNENAKRTANKLFRQCTSIGGRRCKVMAQSSSDFIFLAGGAFYRIY